MEIADATQDVPLTALPDGSIRIADSRVSLDSLIYHYRHGATVEEIALKFPGLRLADIHACIAYFLNHQEEVDRYLVQRDSAAFDLRQRIAGDPIQQSGINKMRERIQARLKDRDLKVS